MDNSGFQKIKEIDFTENSARSPGKIRPRMFRQAMIKDRDNNIYAVYGDRLKKGTPDFGLGPWDVNIINTGTSYEAVVTPGTINGILPSNMWDKFNIGDAKERYLQAEVKFDSNKRAVDSATLSFVTTPPPPDAAVKDTIPASSKILLGVIKDQSAYNLSGKKNIGLYVAEAGRTTRVNAKPNESVWEIWYIWARN
jgi:hypothetical protein